MLKSTSISLTQVVPRVYILRVGVGMGPELWSRESLYQHPAPALVGLGCLHLPLCNLRLALPGLAASWEQKPRSNVESCVCTTSFTEAKRVQCKEVNCDGRRPEFHQGPQVSLPPCPTSQSLHIHHIHVQSGPDPGPW